ncbi:nickel transporter [Chania multitudinisentens RB-25]|uniref:Nickel/cobalt efflux system n=1 Tax=Chania multitudinisentens RB-25 TaxID=1441930 RepID=W0L9T0_9GAMM|nr:nickel/cobalt transporter [Chania multitudinisentens]AHG19149.1 nickel transporter [Chania multitudinisentens RB-25]
MRTQAVKTTPINIAGLGIGGLLLAALLYLFVRHWAEFVQYCINFQIYMHRYLVTYLLQQQNHQYHGGVMLVLGSFLYGFLHSIGPGHGKFVITTYLATHRQQLNISRVITLFGSLLQGVMAVLFVLILAVIFNFSMGDLSLSRYWVEKGSAVFIACFGLMLLLRASGWRLRRSPVIRALPASPRLSAATVAHHHDENCHCGHKHLPNANELTGGWRNALWVITAIGIRPCSGAILILVFANAIGMFTWGVIAAMSMALGTALSIMILATLVHHLRERFINTSGALINFYLPQATRIAMILGGIMLLLFALILFSSVIPVSANGDFITAGC